MKVKTNSNILLAAILLACLIMSSCNFNRKECGLCGHQEPTGTTTDTFWAPSGKHFLIIPTTTIIIIDSKGATIAKAGVVVSEHFGNNNVISNVTNGNGSTTVQTIGTVYPVTFTASDGQHQFTPVTFNAPPMSNPVKITELNSDTVVTVSTK